MVHGADAVSLFGDELFPFLLNHAAVRGRALRLERSVSEIINRYNYPPAIRLLLAEALGMVAILSSNLKQDGIFTLQIQSKGALSLLVADATAGGRIRGYADLDKDRYQPSLSLQELCADGYLAITLDPGDGGQRYQGIVPLEGDNLSHILQHYFEQSQQLPVLCRFECEEQQGIIRAAGMYLEYVPEDDTARGATSDAWETARALFSTIKRTEMLDESLLLPDLLYRLFHEDGVWVYAAKQIEAHCRCDRAKIQHTIAQMGQVAIYEMLVDGKVSVTCQFCNNTEVFTPEDLGLPPLKAH